MYQNVQTCILEVNSTGSGIKLPVNVVFYVRSSLPHTQRARLQTCIAVTKNTQIHESVQGYIRGVGYLPTLAVLPYNTMTYCPKQKFNYFHHC